MSPLSARAIAALKRQYPHVDGITDWRAEQTVRLLWDRIFDLEERLTASQGSIDDLIATSNTQAETLTTVQTDAQHALALSQQPGATYPSGEGAVTSPPAGSVTGPDPTLPPITFSVGSGTGNDEIDPTLVTWLHTNPTTWLKSSLITGITITRDTVCLPHTKAGLWPQSPLGAITVEGNPWIFAFIRLTAGDPGSWYAATWDWLRPGQTCKGVQAIEFGRDQIRIHPMDGSWLPRQGDSIGFMVSTRARDGVAAGQERSDIRRIVWPY